MTDDTASAPLENGSLANGGAETAPSVRVLAQYVKDFSFENPNAPNSLREGTQPKIDLQLDVSARAMDESGVFEVDLKINARSDREGQTQFIIELVYSGLFQFANVPGDALEPLLLAECPKILFPFARQLIATNSQAGGYPPLMLDPMDFGALYATQRVERAGGQPS
ncbi:protein-export chaperone SecB [Aquidulcibacter sp.]|uniref:protein-export chaperone SecB n=1 Tax=Aquidulcibacter sp. TaxID=2052990 RepID=UPI003BA6F948